MRIPTPLSQCGVPEVFSPSQLASGSTCLLRTVLGSARELPALTAHPAAAIGKVFHKLLELAVRGQVERASSPSEDVRRALERLLDEEQARVSRNWAAPAPQLRAVFPPLVWRRKQRVVLDLAEAYLTGRVPRSAINDSSSGRTARELSDLGSWPELHISVPELRLSGRIDLLQREAGDVIIRDLKTGRVASEDGEVLPHIELQMRLYGLMARRTWPRAAVRLIVDYGIEREVPFGPMEEVETEKWLSECLARLPAQSAAHADTLASPGAVCEFCVYRHICPAYRRAAPEFWKGPAAVRMPLDTWGTLHRIDLGPNGQFNATVRDAAGRTVKAFGLQQSRLNIAREGEDMWLFGLRTRERRGSADGWHHPLNFFEIAEDDPFAQAWSLQVFGGDDRPGEDSVKR
jgi:RecB family exonuclease